MRRGDRVEEGDVAVEGWAQACLSPGSSGHTATESPGQRDMSPWRVVRRPLSDAAGSLPGALRAVGPSSAAPSEYLMNTSHPPPRPRASAAPCWPTPSTRRRRSWSREHRASCGERMRDPSGPRACVSASSAALRSTRRASATFKRGGPQGALESVAHAGFFSLGV